MALFKSKAQREAERRVRVRRARKRLSTQVAKLRKQRDKYYALGQEAARQGRQDKVKLLARSIIQFRRMEKRFQDILITLELFEAQKDVMNIQSDFANAMKACSLSIRDSNATKALADLETEVEQANALVEQATEQVDMFLESAPEGMLEAATAESEELQAIERDLLQGAQESERAATPDTIDADIEAVQEELRKEI